MFNKALILAVPAALFLTGITQAIACTLLIGKLVTLICSKL